MLASVNVGIRLGAKQKQVSKPAENIYSPTGGVCCFATHLMDFNDLSLKFKQRISPFHSTKGRDPSGVKQFGPVWSVKQFGPVWSGLLNRPDHTGPVANTPPSEHSKKDAAHKPPCQRCGITSVVRNRRGLQRQPHQGKEARDTVQEKTQEDGRQVSGSKQ